MGHALDRQPLDAEAAQQVRTSLQAAREALPIWAARKQLVDEVRGCRTLVLVGETGSGKTTQLPHFLLAAGLAQVNISSAPSSYKAHFTVLLYDIWLCMYVVETAVRVVHGAGLT